MYWLPDIETANGHSLWRLRVCRWRWYWRLQELLELLPLAVGSGYAHLHENWRSVYTLRSQIFADIFCGFVLFYVLHVLNFTFFLYGRVCTCKIFTGIIIIFAKLQKYQMLVPAKISDLKVWLNFVCVLQSPGISPSHRAVQPLHASLYYRGL